MSLSNEEIVTQKAAITAADALATNGKLNDAQSMRFIDYVVDETVLKNNARVVRFRNENLDIDKIGIGARAAMPKAEARDPQMRRGVTTSKVTLTPKEIMVPFEVSDIFRELNIEGDDVTDHIIQMFARQMANDIEEVYITGNTLGHSIAEASYKDGYGSTTDHIKDSYLAMFNGWQRLADSANVVDAANANIGLGVFGKALRALPTKFRRNKKQLRWFMSPDLWQLYLEKLSSRGTALGDAAAGGASHGPFGIPAVEVPVWDFLPPEVEHIVLTGTTATALRNKNVSSVVVTPSTLDEVPTTPYVVGAGNDYILDATNGTIARDAASTIVSGATVKVTYDAAPQLLLTHQNNFIVGIGRDIRIEKDRNIWKGTDEYAITAKISVNFEELTALVKVRNIGTGV